VLLFVVIKYLRFGCWSNGLSILVVAVNEPIGGTVDVATSTIASLS
jgi:hypothetical protein